MMSAHPIVHCTMRSHFEAVDTGHAIRTRHWSVK
jgi:hypothetical protein